MSNDLISRKSVLDYIEKEIAKCESTETLCYLRALSVHINEFEPTAYDIDKVVRKLDLLIMDEECKLIGSSKLAFKETLKKKECYKNARDIVKAGGIDG